MNSNSLHSQIDDNEISNLDEMNDICIRKSDIKLIGDGNAQNEEYEICVSYLNHKIKAKIYKQESLINLFNRVFEYSTFIYLSIIYIYL